MRFLGKNPALVFWVGLTLSLVISFPPSAIGQAYPDKPITIYCGFQLGDTTDLMALNPHPTTLVGKTVVLREDGRHNSDNFLERVAQLLEKPSKNIKVIKTWKAAPETYRSSQNPDLSKEFAEKVASFKPDFVIASQCD